MILSKAALNNINPGKVIIPNEAIFNLPEKVLQFGTGVLLRGLPDFFIDKANRNGVFNGRIAVVKSTAKGTTSEFDDQDNLYTLCIRGLDDGVLVKEDIISSSISRVIVADKYWDSILTIARHPDLKLIISNTTEVGIQLLEESIHQNPPVSFPAKLLAVLYERYKAFEGSKEAGIVIIATELIPDNGKKLEEIVFALSKFNHLDNKFMTWLEAHVSFCNSLVDRIVPGKPDQQVLKAIESELGYSDNLLSMTEPYCLWAIEGGSKVAEVLDFAKVDEGVILTEDIELYRELKVRLLNGTHTLSSGIAFLSGIETVTNAMQKPDLRNYISKVMQSEIIPAIPYDIIEQQALIFSKKVLDRFANPFIAHSWISITAQYTTKIKIRILPLLLNSYKLLGHVPMYMAFGFAAYLKFMKPVKKEGNQYYGLYNDINYVITDEHAAYFYDLINLPESLYITTVLSNVDFWGTSLCDLPGFAETIKQNYQAISEQGMTGALAELTSVHN